MKLSEIPNYACFLLRRVKYKRLLQNKYNVVCVTLGENPHAIGLPSETEVKPFYRVSDNINYWYKQPAQGNN